MDPAENPTTDPWLRLRRTTQARIGLGRAGDGLPTRRHLEFQAAHAAARDAVHQPLDVAALTQVAREIGIEEMVVVKGQPGDRGEYLRRPDLGRAPASLGGVPVGTWDVGVVLADGLSPRAVQEHGVPQLQAVLRALPPELSVAPIVVATAARVALGDAIGQRLGVQTVIVLIGERPGLSVADSLGAYLTHLPRPGRVDAERNCVSNIHPPDGLGYERAAQILAGLVMGARQLGRSGVDLKDQSVIDQATVIDLRAAEPAQVDNP